MSELHPRIVMLWGGPSGPPRTFRDSEVPSAARQRCNVERLHQDIKVSGERCRTFRAASFEPYREDPHAPCNFRK